MAKYDAKFNELLLSAPRVVNAKEDRANKFQGGLALYIKEEDCSADDKNNCESISKSFNSRTHSWKESDGKLGAVSEEEMQRQGFWKKI